ncbi:hypothetical protein [Aliivibrio fischeri]|uniref:hypothetical protein n=1 Tax=Aliivibrio fischeri TaxID=668 RepID=UPI0012D9C73C|nr:hypothetical protein [Aliivibrio fischeri]MUJ19444.1 hypothetical protein [Aliivibrio fischeri]
MKFIVSVLVFLLGIAWMTQSFDWGTVTFTCSSLVASLALLPKNNYWARFKRRLFVKKQKITLSEESVLETSSDKLFSIFEALVIEREIDLIIEHKGLTVFRKHANKETSLPKKNSILKQMKRWEKELNFLHACLLMSAKMYRKNHINLSKEQIYSIFQELIKKSFINTYQPRNTICLYRKPYDGDSFIVSLDNDTFNEMLGYLKTKHNLEEEMAHNALRLSGFYTVSDLPKNFVQSHFISAHIAHIVTYELDESSMHFNSWYIGL